MKLDWLVGVIVSAICILPGAEAGGGGTGLAVTAAESPLVPAALVAVTK